MNRVVHFEIHASDPERAATFYRDAFGWDIKEWTIPGIEIPAENRYWLITTGPENEPGIDGGIMLRHGPAPSEGQATNSYICTIEVASVDESSDKVVNAGGSVTGPKMAVQGVGWLIYCKDTEGNIFGMMESDENAR